MAIAAQAVAQEPYRCRILAVHDVPVAVAPDGKCFAGERLISYESWLRSRRAS